MTRPVVDDQLRPALDQFEQSIQTPIVSGELMSWLAEVQKSCAEVEQRMRGEERKGHAEAIDEIASLDPDQLERVAQLRASEQQLLDTADTISLKISQLCDRAEAVEPDEAKLSNPVAELIKLSLAFVQDVRKQEVCVSTWLSEALNRDIGVAD